MAAVWDALFGVAGLLFGALICRDLEGYGRRIGRTDGSPPQAADSSGDRPASTGAALLGRDASGLCLTVGLCTGALFVAAVLRYGAGWRAVLVAPFLGVMLTLGQFDARRRLLPNRLVYPSVAAFGVAVIALSTVIPLHLVGALLGAVLYAGALLLVALVSPRSMGMGDVKLAALIGLVVGALGPEWLFVAAFVGVLTAGLGGVAVLVKYRTSGRTMPLGPYLAAAAIVASLYGGAIYSWYRSFG